MIPLLDDVDLLPFVSSFVLQGTPAVKIDKELQTDLLNLCTRDGTPGQARSAVYTMAALMDPSRTKIASSSSSLSRKSLTQEKQQEAFGSVLKSLTLPSRLTLASGSNENGKLISILTALAALAESAPALFSNDDQGGGKSGEKAIKFALDTCLLGRGSSVDDDSDSDANDGNDDDDDMAEEEMAKETPKRRRSRKSGGSVSKNMTPDGTVSPVEDESLSYTCRRLCAAIELLTSYVRHVGNPTDGSTVAEDRVEQIFSILCQIMEDGGLPPASRDRRECKSRQDRAGLRKCAAINLLRLCDNRLKLQKKFLSTERWHTLAGSLLDEERSVRSGVMEELGFMLACMGPYAANDTYSVTMPPDLRFVAMVSLCVDVDHGAGHSGANANAANVGKMSATVKACAIKGVSSLRVTSDSALTQCRALGPVSEQRFENEFKMLLMPEYAVPYALHLLSFRRETPSAGGTTGSGLTQTQPTSTQEIEEEAFVSVDEENQHKVLRKRLKWLFEPLVASLGERADNISFLLRMVDLLGNNHMPVNFVAGSMEATSPLSPNSLLSDNNSVDEATDSASLKAAAVGAAKLKTICVAAREVLLSFVKKDVNLSPYPGAILLPKNLFRHAKGIAAERASLSQQSGDSGRASMESSASLTRDSGRKRASFPESILTSGRKKSRTSRPSPKSTGSLNRDSLDSTASVGTEKSRRTAASQDFSNSAKRNSRVHFSPELVQPRSARSSQGSPAVGSDDEGDGFAEGLSPIAKSQSPSPPPSNLTHRSPTSEEKTVGTTPPSILRTAPQDDESDDGDARLSMESEKSESTAGSTRSTRSSARRKVELTEASTAQDDESNDEKVRLSMDSEKSDSTTGSTHSPRRSPRRKSKPDTSIEAIESEETMTTSETPLSADPDEDVHSSGEKRKPKRVESTREKKKSKTLSRGDESEGKKQSSRGGRRGKIDHNKNGDVEFDFPDDDKNKENGTKRRSRKKESSSPTKKRKPQKTLISMGKSKASRRARRT